MMSTFDVGEWAAALWADERGQNMTEYGLLLVLIAIAAVAAIEALGGGVVDVWDRTRDMLQGNAGNGS